MRSTAKRVIHLLSSMVLGLWLPCASVAQFPEPAAPDSQRIIRRWVGAQMSTLPLWLDFYADTMVVVSDNVNRFAADFALTPDSLVIFGDSTLVRVLAVAFDRRREGEDFGSRSSFGMRYRFSLDRLLVTAGATTITMTPQNVLARPIEVLWTAILPEGRTLELLMYRGVDVRRRVVPGGSWESGKWERDARDLVFDWSPDSLETPDSTLIWHGIYDAAGEQIVLDNIGEGTGTTILRRVIR